MASAFEWIYLSVIAFIAFWCQATVTEERLVPALNVIADLFNIPDDIAGATLMAAGGSSPELFSSFVALFITHSSLGLGTVVGSEIFNQCAICAGAVFSAKSGKLVLNKAILIREVSFYALSILLFYIALLDVRDRDGIDYIYISFWQALLVFSGYLAYVFTCANFTTILTFFSKAEDNIRDEETNLLAAAEGDEIPYGTARAKRHQSIRLPEGMPFIHEKKIAAEPSSNFESADVVYFRSVGNESASNEASERQPGALESQIRALGMTVRSTRSMSFLMHSEKPSQIHGVEDIEVNEADGTISCFLWQRSYFYGKAYFSLNGWHLRWFTFMEKDIHSVPDRVDSEKHDLVYPHFKDIEVDDVRKIIRIINPTDGKRDFFLMAPTEEILDRVVEKMEEVITARMDDPDLIEPADDEADGGFDSADGHEGLLDYPVGGGPVALFFFFFMYPFRVLMHYTVPDVRVLDHQGNSKATAFHAFSATFLCLIWLIIGSYAMVASLEALAALMAVPDTVVGVTVSAAGTSLPNYVASCVAAKRGFGNMAVSNVFGSNTFNIVMALGLPWTLYTAIVAKFGYYDELEATGIIENVVILASYLLIFIVLIFPFGFVIRKWHGILFLFLYACYLAYEIASVYVTV